MLNCEISIKYYKIINLNLSFGNFYLQTKSKKKFLFYFKFKIEQI